MKLIDFIKLVLKHKVPLVVLPLMTVLLAIILTSNVNKRYYSQTMLFTGLASGSSIDMDKSFNYFATNIAFDNLINIVNSRETQEEVAIRLLSQHLLLDAPNPMFISKENYEELKEVVPDSIYKYVIKTSEENIQEDIDQTVLKLTAFMKSDNQNFVYSLLNFEHPIYSLEAISKIKATRMSNSDLVKLSYESDDPGICQQTLAIFNEVCIRKYKDLKENGSDAVVKYFEAQLVKSQKKLKGIEDRLLKFNQDNSIINYYEQSKAVAIVKEDMEVRFNKKIAELAGSEASSKKLEQKLEIQELIQQKSNQIVKDKKRLGDLNYEIVMLEAKGSNSEEANEKIKKLKEQSNKLNAEIEESVNELYSFQNTIDGVPIKKVLPQYVDQVVETEDLKATLEVMDKRNKEFDQKYAKYAPAGANLKRIEREIEVAEEEYLELLHGLNLAKLKFQDTQLSSNLKAVDPPYYPLKPMPSKRKLIIVAVFLMSFIMLLASILVMEFFDDTLKNIEVASEKLKLSALGMMPKISRAYKQLDFERIQERLLEFMVKNLNHALKMESHSKQVKTILIMSTLEHEGKTVLGANLSQKLRASGKSVLMLSHEPKSKENFKIGGFPLMHRLFGYQDPRTDYNQPFFTNAEEFMTSKHVRKYQLDTNFYNAKSFKDLSILNSKPIENTEIVVVELPNILEHNYPAELIENADLTILVCRSNRLWSAADDNLLSNIKELTTSKLRFIINGTELREVETILGELPKKRSNTRKRLKEVLQFQFYSRNQI